MSGTKKFFFNKMRGFIEIVHFKNAFQVILDRFFNPTARLLVYRIGRLEIPVDRSGGDIGSIRACLASPMYRQFLTTLSPKKPLNVLDLGAHVGGFGLLVDHLGFKIERLVAVELNPGTALRLSYNLESNLRERASLKVLNAGVSGERGSYRGSFGWGSISDSLVIGPDGTDGRGCRQAEVTLMTIDEVVSSEFGAVNIDLCKIDIEGAEYEIFEGVVKALKRIDYIIVEIHERPSKEAGMVLGALQKAGFELLGEDLKERNYFLKNKAL